MLGTTHYKNGKTITEMLPNYNGDAFAVCQDIYSISDITYVYKTTKMREWE